MVMVVEDEEVLHDVVINGMFPHMFCKIRFAYHKFVVRVYAF